MAFVWTLLVVAITSVQLNSADFIPVIVWRHNDAGKHLAQPLVLKLNHTPEFLEFLSGLNDASTSNDEVFVYVQNKLSSAHYRHGVGSLNLPESLRNGSKSVNVLPRVENPLTLIKEWQSSLRRKRSAINSFVESDYSEENDDFAATMSSFWERYNKKKKSILIYSGGSKPIIARVQNRESKMVVDRHLLFFYRSFGVPSVASDGSEQHIKKIQFRMDQSTFGMKSFAITLPGDSHITMHIQATGHHWDLEKVEFNGEKAYADTQIRSVLKGSYSCPGAIKFFSENGGRVLFTIYGLKVQPEFLGRSNVMFNDADQWTCGSYMTVPILMGLLVSFMLIAVLLFAIVCMMDIHSCDQFQSHDLKT